MLQYKLTPMTVKFSITCTEIKTASTCRILVFIYKYANQINVNILKSAINFHFTTPIVRRRERGMHLTKLDPPRSPVLVSQYFSQIFLQTQIATHLYLHSQSPVEIVMLSKYFIKFSIIRKSRDMSTNLSKILMRRFSSQ